MTARCAAIGVALVLSLAGCLDERLIGTRNRSCDGGEPCPPSPCVDDDDDDPDEPDEPDDDCEIDERDGSTDDDALPDF